MAPGELHGVDVEESQIGMARAAAKAGGHDNATFHIADVTDLPFEDNSFDVAHCHAVLMHVPDTQAALAEVRRVLKPGGIVSAREMFVESSFFEPGHTRKPCPHGTPSQTFSRAMAVIPGWAKS